MARREESPSCRRKMISDVYFENKRKASRTRNLSFVKFAETKERIEISFDSLGRLKACSSKILKYSDQIGKTYRRDEKQLYICFFVVLYGINSVSVDKADDKIMQMITSKELREKLLEYTKRISNSDCFEDFYVKTNATEALKIYNLINLTLYGYTLTKLIHQFIILVFQINSCTYKKLQFIDYFTELGAVKRKILSKGKKIQVRGVTPLDQRYETTKDDEYATYTNGNEVDYEDFFTKEGEVLNTDPDAKEKLILRFYDKFNRCNPYEFEKKTTNKSRLRSGLRFKNYK